MGRYIFLYVSYISVTLGNLYTWPIVCAQKLFFKLLLLVHFHIYIKIIRIIEDLYLYMTYFDQKLFDELNFINGDWKLYDSIS